MSFRSSNVTPAQAGFAPLLCTKSEFKTAAWPAYFLSVCTTNQFPVIYPSYAAPSKVTGHLLPGNRCLTRVPGLFWEVMLVAAAKYLV